MKLLTIVLLSIVALSSSSPIADYIVMKHALQVPEDPDSWVFNGDNRSSPKGSKISNGQQASDTQFPWTVEMSINVQNGGILCTSSLISNRWLLGARHCIADTNAVSVQAKMGSASRQGNRVIVFSDLFVWLNSGSGTNHPDIAVFRLAQTVSLSSVINVVQLPARSQENWTFEGFTMTASGWGGVGGGALSNYLQWTEFRVLSRSSCDFGSTVLCSQPPTGYSSLEGGDSGGPSVIYEYGTPIIIGINVFVATSGSNKWQGSTRVGAYLDFISSQTGIPIRN